MAPKRGISILDLIGVLPAGSQVLIPADIEAQLEKLTVLEYRSTTTDDVHIHYGTVQSVADSWLPSLRNWPVEVPLLNAGVPFQMVRARTPKGANTLEPAAASFFIDLFLNRIAITIPGLKPAKLVPGADQTAAHLVPDAGRDKVRIVGGGTLRMMFPAAGAPQVLFVAPTDGLDPNAPTGAVVDLTFDPPQFFIGGSDIGLRVDRLTYDDSVDFTPPEIVARQQGPEWRGISIKEATAFLPRNARWIGDMSVSVRDVLLGSPMGLQGEIQIEFGRTPVGLAGLEFFQAKPDGEFSIGSPAPESTDPRSSVLNVFTTGEYARVRAKPKKTPLADNATHFWTLPGGDTHLGDEVEFFNVHDRDVLRVSSIEKSANETPGVSPSNAIWFSLKHPDDLLRPIVKTTIPDVRLQGAPLDLENVAFVSGTADQLNTIILSTTLPAEATTGVEWRVGVGMNGGFGTGPTFTPKLPAQAATYDLVVSRPTGPIRRVRIEVLTQGSLIVGAQSGVYRIVGTVAAPITVRGIDSTFRAAEFHPSAVQLSAPEPATLDSTSQVVAPEGSIAAVSVELGSKDDPEAIPLQLPDPEPIRTLHVLMNFGTTEEYDWGEKRLADPFSVETLRKWAMGFPGSDFDITGRTCNIGTVPRNLELAEQRAQRGKALLCDASLPGPQVNPDHVTNVAGEKPNGQGKIKIDEDHPDLTGDNRYLPPRPAYRRSEITATGQALDAPLVPSMNDRVDPVLRRAFVPGADPQSFFVPDNPEATQTYRVRLVVRWDSPTVATLSDAIPTLAELLVSWPKEKITVPSLPSGPNVEATPEGPETFTLVGRWTYDSRSGETMFSLSFSNAGSPDGLFSITNDTAATAFALGPALLSGLSAMDAGGKAIHIGALLGACAFVAAKPGTATNGKVTFYGITVEEKQRSLSSLEGSRQRLLFDYTAQVGFNIDAGGLKVTAEKPLKVRYKNAGIEIDNSKTGFDRFGIVYDQCSFDIEDPGQWTIEGPLGKLLRVTGTRAGSGSTWMEVDLAFCLDLDTVKVTNATVRVNFPTGNNEFGIELRGLGVEVNIPGAIKGGGRLAIGDEGSIKAGLDIEIIPAKVIARGGLALDGAMCNLELGLLLPVGIPLGSSGLGLYGFLGRFVSNGKRLLPSNPDPVEREIAWYRTLPENKYEEARAQWALGLGAVIGTLPDTAFTFNAMGMLTIAFPDPEAVLSLDAKMLQTASLPKEEGDPAVAGLNLLGIMVFSDEAFVLGIRGTYAIPKLLKLEVPINGFFPFDGKGSSYLRIGADGVDNRKGEPVTITVFPDILDLKAWAYLMIEEKQLHNLGGREKFDLDGFSVGFGTGFALNWSAGPIKLSASAEMMVGLGTKPFTLVGHIGVRGELSLVIISISASAEIDARILKRTEDDFYWELDGFVEGKVDLFLFTISGRVDVHLDSGGEKPQPVPDHPLRRVDLTDRNGVITGRATGGEEAASDLPSTVWPDTVPLLHFSHFVQNAFSGSAFAPQPAVLDGDDWSGTSDLKFAYRLKGLRLVKKGGAELAGPLDSVWWWPTHRGGVLNPDDPPPSEHESRLLALLSWHPFPWHRNRTDGGAGTAADPATTLEHVCQPSPAPLRNCATTNSFTRTGVDSIQFAPLGKGLPPFSTFFTCFAKETGGGQELTTYQVSLAESGQHLVPGTQRPFSTQLVIPIESHLVSAGYELGYAASQNRFIKTTQFEATLGPNLVGPALTLAVWEPGDKVICDYFPDLHPQKGALIFPREGVDYSSSGVMETDENTIVISSALRITFPVPTKFVTLTLLDTNDFSGISVKGRDSNLSVVYDQQVFGSPGEPFTITLADLGIKMIDLTPGPKIPKLTEEEPGTPGVQVMEATPEPETAELLPGQGLFGSQQLAGVCWAAAGNLTPPVVTGVLSDSSTSNWTPQVVGTTAIPPVAAGGVKIIRYTPATPGAWSSVRINEYTGGHVSVVSISGVPWTADKLAKGNEITKQQIKDQLSAKASSDAPEKKTLLEANTAYEIQVDCQWQRWQKTKGQPTPPPPNESKWQDFDTAVFSFQTAAEAVPSVPLPPVDFKNETTFDPRGIARYIIGVRPDGNSTPHFLKDPIQVDFSIDHMEQLLEAYQRKLALKLRRTDPGVNTLPGFVTPSDINSTLALGPLPFHLKSKADQYFIESFANAPCVQPPDIGGTSIKIQADLQPNAEYDLMLVAVPASNPDSDEVLVYRSHFRTSRYQNPGEMLKSIGFLNPNPNPVLPHDAILEVASIALGKSLENDADFDEALRILKLDPWPLLPDPRTVVLWKQNGQGYQLAGVMLEHNEPMVRSGRMNLAAVNLQTGNTTTKQALELKRTNAAGTRALLLPATPLVVGANDRLELAFDDNSSQILAHRYVHTTPRMVYEEVL